LSVLVPRTEFGPINGLNFAFAWRSEAMEAYLLSDVGKKRRNNEDSCIMCAPSDPALFEERGCLFAVADGMGGASAGEYASRLALNILVETYFKSPLKPAPIALKEAVEKANERIFEEADINPLFSGMGTTVSGIVILGGWMYVVQVGDSRVYLWRERAGLHQVTRDHSLVAEQVRSGIISEEEARNHSLKNLITRAVGIKDKVKVDVFAVRIKPEDTLLLCSDGLSGLVSDPFIADMLQLEEIKSAAHRLIEKALDGGGTDNITAVIVRILEISGKTTLQEGAEEVVIARKGFFRRLFGR